MDNNPVTTPPVNNPIPLQQPQVLKAKSNLGRNLVMIISAVLIVVILIATGYLLFLNNTKKSVNTQVYVQPTVPAGPTATPTPSAYQINPKDTSDNAITNDAAAVNQSLGNLDSDLSNVDQSFNDQQTNLQ
jgi:hypothetical protein